VISLFIARDDYDTKETSAKAFNTAKTINHEEIDGNGQFAAIKAFIGI